jgi:hypothetical protein
MGDGFFIEVLSSVSGSALAVEAPLASAGSGMYIPVSSANVGDRSVL